MKQENYSRSIVVTASPMACYQALTTGYSHWWTACDNCFEQVGDRVKFCFPPQSSYWTFEAVSLKPDRCVTLKCVDAYHIVNDKPDSRTDEWHGTELLFSIEPDEGITRIHFTHQGLISSLACFDVCEAGWDRFFVQSLQQYLNTGIGNPH